MKKILSLGILFAFLFLTVGAAQAASMVLKGRGGELITLESAPDLGENAYLIKIEDAGSPWDGKVFRIEKKTGGEFAQYGFEYSVELSSGTIKRYYHLLEVTGTTLVEGTRVHGYHFYLPEKRDEPLIFVQDLPLSDAYKKGFLAESYKQTPYTPVLE